MSDDTRLIALEGKVAVLQARVSELDGKPVPAEPGPAMPVVAVDAALARFDSLPDVPPTGYLDIDGGGGRWGYFANADTPTHQRMFNALAARGIPVPILNQKINEYFTSKRTEPAA